MDSKHTHMHWTALSNPGLTPHPPHPSDCQLCSPASSSFAVWPKPMFPLPPLVYLACVDCKLSGPWDQLWLLHPSSAQVITRSWLCDAAVLKDSSEPWKPLAKPGLKLPFATTVDLQKTIKKLLDFSWTELEIAVQQWCPEQHSSLLQKQSRQSGRGTLFFCINSA